MKDVVVKVIFLAFVLNLGVNAKAADGPPVPTETPSPLFNQCVRNGQEQISHCNPGTTAIVRSTNPPTPDYEFSLIFACRRDSDGLEFAAPVCSLPKSAISTSAQAIIDQTVNIMKAARLPVLVCGSVMNINQRSLGESFEFSGGEFRMNYESQFDISRKAERKVQFQYGFNTAAIRTVEMKVNGISRKTTTFPALSVLQYSDFVEPEWMANLTPFVKTADIDLVLSAPYNYSGPYTGSVPLDTSRTHLAAYDALSWGLGGWTPSVHNYYDPQSKTIFFGYGSSRQIQLPRKVFEGYGEVYWGTDEAGTEVYLFDDLGRHLETKTALMGATKWRFEYLPDHKLSKIYNRVGLFTEFLRDTAGNWTAIKSPFGQTTQVFLNAQGRLIHTEDAIGATHDMAYGADGNGLLSQMSYPNGLQTQWTYDNESYLIDETKNNGGFFGIVGTVTNDLKQWTTQTAAGIRKGIETISNASLEKTTQKDLAGNLLEETQYTSNSESNKTVSAENTATIANDIRFGANARQPSAIQTLWKGNVNVQKNTSHSQSVSYLNGDGPFNIAELKDTFTSNAQSTVSTFNGAGRYVEVKSPLQFITRYQMDEKERLTRVSTPGQLDTVMNYNSAGQLSQIQQGQLRTQLFYDGNGNLHREISSAGRTTQYESDANGRLRRKILPNGDQIAYEYSSGGGLKKLTAPNGKVHQFQLGIMDQLASYLPPALSGLDAQTRYEYDADGRLTRIQSPTGLTAQYFYKTGTPYLEKITTNAGDYLFEQLDAGGRPHFMTSPDGIRMETFWSGDRIHLTKWSNGSVLFGTTNYSFDNLFRVSNLATPYNQQIGYTYDADNRPIQIADERFTYDRRTESLVNTNGNPYSKATQTINITQGAVTSTVSRISQDDPTGFANLDSTTTTISAGSQPKLRVTVEHETDAIGNSKERITKEVFTGTTVSARDVTTNYFTNDANGRLIRVEQDSSSLKNGVTSSKAKQTSANYFFPPGSNGNIKTYEHGGRSTTATYDDQDRLVRLLGSISKELTYSDDGSLKTITNCNGSRAYEYDVFGNLKGVTLPDGKVISYKYDAMNRRVARFVNGQVSEYYGWKDQTHLSTISRPNGSVRIQYYYSPQNEIAPSYMDMDQKRYKIVANHRGDVLFVVALDGAIAQEISYDEYGMVIKDSSVTATNKIPFQPLGFVSGLNDVDTGLVKFGARDYDPVVGRWTSKDPIGFRGGDTNLYGYVANDPVNWIDPSGLKIGYADANSRNTLQPLIEQLMQSPAGAALVNQLESSSAIYTLQVVSGGPLSPGTTFRPIVPGSNGSVHVDQCPNVNFDSNKGTQLATPLRILAHELGHLTGTRDNGPGRMNNVNGYENPIMTPIDGLIRTSY